MSFKTILVLSIQAGGPRSVVTATGRVEQRMQARDRRCLGFGRSGKSGVPLDRVPYVMNGEPFGRAYQLSTKSLANGAEPLVLTFLVRV